jgi:hypothetical protein
MRVAKADFIASVDSDDYIEPTMMEVLWEATDSGLIDIVCCGFDFVNEEGKQLSSRISPPGIIENENNSINIFSVMTPSFWNKLWRRSLYIDNEIFFPDHLYFEDMATTPRILAYTKCVKIIDNCLYHYRIRDNSITNSYGPKHMIDYLKGFEILLGFLKKNNLYDRYREQFMSYIDLCVRFHSNKVIESKMSEHEITQYLGQFLMQKIAFFEYYDLIESMNNEKLLKLLETAKRKEDLV